MSGDFEDERTTTYTPIRVVATAVARDEIGHYLVMLEGVEPGRRILIESRELSIGRDAARDVVLADPDVSRLHASISLRGDQVVVEDQHSTNGTFIDGQRVTRATILPVGAVLKVGQVSLVHETHTRAETAQRDRPANTGGGNGFRPVRVAARP